MPIAAASEADRAAAPERVLQFGTGMLLRAVAVAAVDAGNRVGSFRGRIVVVQSTPSGVAAEINRQRGRFTVVERGMERGAPVERATMVTAISRALIADREWGRVREVAARPELAVIVSNVTEAGFRLDPDEPAPMADRSTAPRSFPAKLTDVLYTRFLRLPDGPPLLVIPTELIPDNGSRLAAMVERLAAAAPGADRFRPWIGRQVRFCSSLVDRITTGVPRAPVAAEIAQRLGIGDDALLTVTEPYWLWAIEGEPAMLREAFHLDVASPGSVVFAPDIAPYRERKLRMLNGAHTAIAPIALLGGVPTVRDAMTHPQLGPLLEQILLGEIVPAFPGPSSDAAWYAQRVLERFRNPWLEHEWRVIATNQTAKFRVRVVPSIVDAGRVTGIAPPGLALALAATIQLARSDGTGWWGGDARRIVDVDRHLIARHWRRGQSAPAVEPVPAALVDGALGDAAIWGRDLRTVPGLVEATTRAFATLQPTSS